MTGSTAIQQQTVVVIGKESVGKSQLITSLTGCNARSENFRGSTVACESYECQNVLFIDTPGIMYGSDTITTKSALDSLRDSDSVLLLAQGTDVDADLRDGLALACGHPCVIAISFWDKVETLSNSRRFVANLRNDLGVPVICLDTRNVTATQASALWAAILDPPLLKASSTTLRAGWALHPEKSLFDYRWVGIGSAMLLLFAPALAATWSANFTAGLIDPVVERMTAAIAGALATLPNLLREMLTGNYGLLTMGPLLLVWALPTVLLYALILGTYKASGVLDRISVALNPLTRYIGLSGRDLIRVLMGYGCNVPAVISTRGCSSSTRNTTISTIAFGSVCSYQFSATVGVFAAARRPLLILPFLLYVLVSTAIMTRMVSPAASRSPFNILVADGRTYLQWPTFAAVWREARSSIVSFCRKAIPVFFGISLLASILNWFGLLQAAGDVLGPLMRAFHLPADCALPVILASIRKDGILVLARTSAILWLRPGQLLTAVYLAGQFVPCLVTVLTIIKECSATFALRLMLRQIVATIFFSLLLANAMYFLNW